MPFLTDRMQDTQRKELLQRALADENTSEVKHVHSGGQNGFLQSRFSFDLDAIEAELRHSIVGQDHAIEALVNILRVVRADIGDPRKPLASVLFCGPTGVGKTETVRTLARTLYGDPDAMCRIDMNTLAQEHYSAALTGAPPGYVGSKEGTTILDQEKIEGTRNLPGIVLFDELEKASNEVVLSLLNVFDNGILTVASGERTYSFRNAIIFMTSNLGAQQLLELQKRGARIRDRLLGQSNRKRDEEAKEIVLDSMLARFPPEFVNRIDHIETYKWIGANTMPRLVDVEVERLNRRLRKHSCRVELTVEVTEYLVSKGYDQRFGARELRRALRHHLEYPLAEYLLQLPNTSAAGETGAGLSLRAERQDGKIVFRHI